MNLFQRLRDAFGLIEEYDEYDEYEEEEEDQSNPSPQAGRRLPGNVIGLPGLAMEMVLMQPRSFDEAPQAVMALRERKSVILNLTLMETDQAQRCADYVAGGAYAIDGHQRQLGPNIFLFTPNFVNITAQSAPELTTGHNPWQAPSGASVTTWLNQNPEVRPTQMPR
ncbi:MAG: cell division protein SepF [Elainella sp. Prado103]|jgi:cell division inhibitor SepF|nr:cell division protein SepF [Elainella sp. Prado103]